MRRSARREDRDAAFHSTLRSHSAQAARPTISKARWSRLRPAPVGPDTLIPLPRCVVWNAASRSSRRALRRIPRSRRPLRDLGGLGTGCCILHLNDLHLISFGERDGSRNPRVEAIASAFSAARFDSRLSTQSFFKRCGRSGYSSPPAPESPA